MAGIDTFGRFSVAFNHFSSWMDHGLCALHFFLFLFFHSPAFILCLCFRACIGALFHCVVWRFFDANSADRVHSTHNSCCHLAMPSSNVPQKSLNLQCCSGLRDFYSWVCLDTSGLVWTCSRVSTPHRESPRISDESHSFEVDGNAVGNLDEHKTIRLE